MPRLFTSDNSPLDFCLQCFPTEKEAEEIYRSLAQGPDGRGDCFAWDADHPNYALTDYTCHQCEKLLRLVDN